MSPQQTFVQVRVTCVTTPPWSTDTGKGAHSVFARYSFPTPLALPLQTFVNVGTNDSVTTVTDIARTGETALGVEARADSSLAVVERGCHRALVDIHTRSAARCRGVPDVTLAGKFRGRPCIKGCGGNGAGSAGCVAHAVLVIALRTLRARVLRTSGVPKHPQGALAGCKRGRRRGRCCGTGKARSAVVESEEILVIARVARRAAVPSGDIPKITRTVERSNAVHAQGVRLGARIRQLALVDVGAVAILVRSVTSRTDDLRVGKLKVGCLPETTGC